MLYHTIAVSSCNEHSAGWAQVKFNLQLTNLDEQGKMFQTRLKAMSVISSLKSA